MVRYLIKLLGEAIARAIERGSRRGAWIGLYFGEAIALTIAYFLLYHFLDDSIPKVAVIIPLLVIGGILGPLIGARFGRPDHLAAFNIQRARVTNLNSALVPVLFLILASAILLFLLRLPPSTGNDNSVLQMCAFVGLCVTGLFIWSCIPIWWIEVTANGVTVRRMLWRRAYRWDEIQNWLFAANGRPATQTPPNTDSLFYITLQSGKTYQVPATPSDAIAVCAVLSPTINSTR